ncbi:MAG: TonB-dependent receptor [Candidatus Marinimicrobia bacterium]|nr:TonB-dependent receptor [Candidatus Neomarinimicrobiota bacterium]
MKKLLVCLLVFTKFLLCFNISGEVVNQETGETIIGVNVVIENLNTGAATDNNGFFIIRNLQSGQYKLQFSHISFRKKVKIVKITDQDIYLEQIELTPKIIENEAIEVVGKRKSLIDEELDISSFEVSPEILTNAPQLNKDVFKLMQYSPSVSISDPFSPLFHVRGSDPGENLVQLDGMTIYNPQHFMSSEAIFNPYGIKNIEMLIGGYGAEHGGRNASILNIVSRDGNKNETRGEFKPSISGISGAMEFPVNNNSTAMLSCRALTDIYSYIALDIPIFLTDLIGKYNTKVGKTNISLTGFYGQDYQDFDIEALSFYFPELDDFEEGFITDTKSYAMGLKTHSVVLPDLLFNTHVYYSGSHVDNETYLNLKETEVELPTDLEVQHSTSIMNRIADWTVKSNLTYYTFLNQTLKLGFELNYLDFINQIGKYAADKQTSSVNLQSAYLQDKIKIGQLNFNLGLRNSKLSRDNNWRMEPRLSANYRLGPTTFKAHWGKYNQYLTTLDKQRDEFVETLQYFQSLENYKPVASEKFSLGLEHYLNENTSLSVTAYYKDLYRLYNLTYDITGERVIEQGCGEAYGLETLLRGEYKRLSGWLAYTYSRGFRNFPSYNDGKEYPYDGDQPHNFKALLFYKLTDDITTSTTFRFSSGYPKTWETGKYSQFSYDPVSNSIGSFPRDITPLKNNVRYPPRMSLEIGWKKKLRDGFGHYLSEYLGARESYYTVSILNVLFLKRDPYYYIFIDSDYGYYALDPYIFPFPTVTTGYVIKF